MAEYLGEQGSPAAVRALASAAKNDPSSRVRAEARDALEDAAEARGNER